MEHGNPSSQSGQQEQAKSGSNVIQAAGESSTKKGAGTENNGNNNRDKNQPLPISKVTKIMRDVLPENARISDEAKETIQNCVSEYISFITSEANEHCLSEHRKTVTAEDLIFALKSLGFEDYVQPLTLYLHRYRYFEGDSSK